MSRKLLSVLLSSVIFEFWSNLALVWKQYPLSSIILLGFRNLEVIFRFTMYNNIVPILFGSTRIILAMLTEKKHLKLWLFNCHLSLRIHLWKRIITKTKYYPIIKYHQSICLEKAVSWMMVWGKFSDGPNLASALFSAKVGVINTTITTKNLISPRTINSI